MPKRPEDQFGPPGPPGPQTSEMMVDLEISSKLNKWLIRPFSDGAVGFQARSRRDTKCETDGPGCLPGALPGRTTSKPILVAGLFAAAEVPLVFKYEVVGLRAGVAIRWLSLYPKESEMRLVPSSLPHVHRSNTTLVARYGFPDRRGRGDPQNR